MVLGFRYQGSGREGRGHPPGLGSWVLGLLLLMGGAAVAAEIDSARVMERYQQMLQQRPRQGTSLERLYRMHVEAMDVDDWLEELEARSRTEDADADASVLAALAILEHGELDAAVRLLDRALVLAPEAAYPRLLKGKILFQGRDYEAAAAVLETALELDASPEDRVEILTLLGTCRVRSGNHAAGIAAWDRILEQVPDDPAVIEDLADVLAEENQLPAAARYYQVVLESPDLSPYQRVLYTSKLAGIHARRDDGDKALALYDAALDQLGPDHWLFSEVLDRIEELYRSRGELDELAAYYEARLAVRSSDPDLLVRLAQVHHFRNDGEQQREALERALDRAPTRTDIHWALAQLLIDHQQWPDAVTRLRHLVRTDPDRLDYALALARILIRVGDPDESIALLRSLSSDAVVAVQAAEILLDEGLTNDGEAFLIRAAELAPGIPEYAERLADHYFATQRPEDGIHALRGMVDATSAGGATWARLAEGLAQRGHLEQALDAAAEAVTRSPESFEAGMVQATLLTRAGRLTEALGAMDRLQPLAPNDYFARDLRDRRIQVLRRTGGLEAAYDRQVEMLQGDAAVDELVMAARMALALRLRDPALEWIERALARDTMPLSLLEQAERMLHELGENDRCRLVLERMLGLAPERTPDILRRVYDLYRQAGDLEAASRTAQRVIQRLPASAEGYRLAAQAAEEMGHLEDAFDFMRRAAQAAPRDAAIRVQFARMLDAGDLPAEALEMYWQAIELAEDPADKFAQIQPMADLYLDLDRFEVFLERLRRWQRTAEEDATPSLALVLAHENVGEYQAAERVLTELAGRHPRDTAVVRRLVKAGEEEGNSDKAIRFQQRLVTLEPSATHYRKLGDLLLDAGDRAGALEAWQSARQRPGTGYRRSSVEQEFTWIDRLWEMGFDAEARDALGALYAAHGGEWRAALRVGAYLWEDDDLAAALPVLRRVVEWPNDETDVRPADPFADDDKSFPAEYETLQLLSMARWMVDQPVQRALATGFGGGGPMDLDQARALALGYLATMKGEIPAFDAWWEELTTGTRAQRQLALKMAVILHPPAETRAMASNLIEAFPDETFARYVLMAPSRSESQAGVNATFLKTVRRQLDWLREHHPEHAWFCDWHYMQLLVQQDEPDSIRAFAEALGQREALDPLLAALVMSLLERSRLYELFERNLDGAAAFYRANGEPAMAEQLVQSLGRMAVQATLDGQVGTALQLLDHYLDASRPVQGIARPALPGVDDLRKPFPLSGLGWDARRTAILRRVFDGMAGLGGEQQLSALMRERVDGASGSDRVDPLLGAAFVSWWNGDLEGAGAHLGEAGDQDPDHPDLPLLQAHFLARTQQSPEALKQLAGMQTRYGARHRLVQGWMLDLATDAGRLDTARAAARELMRMRLNPDELTNLSDRMAAIGMSEEAERIQRRSDRRRDLGRRLAGRGSPSGSLQARAERMAHYLQREQVDRAQAMALQILQVPPGTPAQERSRFHAQALDGLRRMGRLESSVLEAETAFARYPNRDGQVELLFSLYQGVGRMDDARDLVARHLESDATSAETRLHFARLFAGENDLKQAAQQVDWVLRYHPRLLFGNRPEYWLIEKAYQFPGGDEQLLAAMASISADQLIGRSAGRRAGREQVIGNVIGFCRDTLRKESLPPEVVLRLCEAIAPGLAARSRRDRYAPLFLDLKAQALDAMGDAEGAFQHLAACVLAEPLPGALGVDTDIRPLGRPLHAVQFATDRLNATLFRFLDAAEDAGRMETLANELAAAMEAGHGELSLVLALVCLRRGDPAGFEAVHESALNDPAEPTGRQTAGWGLLNQRAIVGQALRDAGQPAAAIDVFRYALVQQSDARSAAMSDTLIKYLVDACTEADRMDLARDTLHELLQTHTTREVSGPAAGARALQTRLKIMRRFYVLGFYEDAMDVGLSFLELKPDPRHRYYRIQAARLLDKIRVEGSAALQDSGRLAAAVQEAEDTLSTSPQGTMAWRKLLWLTPMRDGIEGGGAEVRRRIVEQFPDDMEWRYLVAQSALREGELVEAAAQLEVVLLREPALVFRTPNGYRELLTAFQKGDALDALDQAMRATDFSRLAFSPVVSRSERDVAIRQAVQCAGYVTGAPAHRPALGLFLAQGLRPHVAARSTLNRYLPQLDTTLLAAIRGMDQDAGAQFNALVAMIAGADTCAKLGLDRGGPERLLPWTAGMSWQKRDQEGALPILLGYGKASQQLEALETACAQSSDPRDASYLGAMARLARSEPLPPESIAKAISVVDGQPLGVHERAYLLALLADGLRGAGQGTAAGEVLNHAMDLCRPRGLVDAWLILRKEWIDLARRAGREEDAVEVLVSGPMPRTHNLNPKQARELLARIDQDAAQRLKEMGRWAEAWDRAHRAQSRLILFESGRQVEEIRALLKTIEAEYLPELAESGELTALIQSVQDQPWGGEDSMAMLTQTYQMYQAADKPEAAEGVAEQIRALRPGDARTRLAAARFFAEVSRDDDAMTQYRAVQALSPGLLLQDREQALHSLEIFRRGGHLQDFAAGFAGAGLPGLIRGMSIGDGQANGVADALVAMARKALAGPEAAPECALLLLEPLFADARGQVSIRQWRRAAYEVRLEALRLLDRPGEQLDVLYQLVVPFPIRKALGIPDRIGSPVPLNRLVTAREQAVGGLLVEFLDEIERQQRLPALKEACHGASLDRTDPVIAALRICTSLRAGDAGAWADVADLQRVVRGSAQHERTPAALDLLLAAEAERMGMIREAAELLTDSASRAAAMGNHADERQLTLARIDLLTRDGQTDEAVSILRAYEPAQVRGQASLDGMRAHRASFCREAARRLLALEDPLSALDRLHQARVEEPDRRETVSMRTSILRSTFPKWAEEGRLPPIIHALDARLAEPDPMGHDWETRFWCARAAGDAAGMIRARERVLAASDHPGGAAIEFALLSLAAGDPADAVELLLSVWADSPETWFGSVTTSRHIAEAFAGAGRLDDLAACLAQRPLQKVVSQSVGLQLPAVLALASRLRRADIDEREACLNVVNWIRDTAGDTQDGRRMARGSDSIAEEVLPAIPDDLLAFQEYSRRLCSSSWQRELGVSTPAKDIFWGMTWEWTGTSVACMPAQWVTLAERLNRIPGLLDTVRALASPGAGDRVLAYVLGWRFGPATVPPSLEPEMQSCIASLSTELQPDLDLQVLAWIGLEWHRSGQSAAAVDLLRSVRGEALGRTRDGAQQVAESITLTMAHILADAGLRDPAVALLQEIPALRSTDRILSYLLASAETLHALDADDAAQAHLRRILETTGGENQAYFREQAQQRMDEWRAATGAVAAEDEGPDA